MTITTPRIIERSFDADVADQLVANGASPVLARVLAARGIVSLSQLDAKLAKLLPPEQLSQNVNMAKHLADAVEQGKKLLVIGDYDADGATATAVAIRGLRSMGAIADFLVPNRFEYGYGLTPEIVELAATLQPDILITVDNGIASVEGVERANALGLPVLVTDHHLPGEETPAALCIVNPNQRGCPFPSKHLAGVGVMFYVLLALRAELRQRGLFAQKPEPNLTELLDLVALGTVADLVRLDDNNRILVEQGLRRMRAGKACVGIQALLKVSGRDANKVTAQDLGFSVGPRLNAAGRLDDMSLGIECLITDDAQAAYLMAERLHEFNRQRRSIEADMQEGAMLTLDEVNVDNLYTLAMYDSEWHQGVIGILASRLKERHHRPVIAFASAGEGADGQLILKGSGRSISGLHLRDALDLVSKRSAGLLLKFGGHAMAAGLSIPAARLLEFQQTFESVVRDLITPETLHATIEVDGALAPNQMDWATAEMLEQLVWGQGFPPPLFRGEFEVLDQRIVGEKHLKLKLNHQGHMMEGIFFQQSEFLPNQVQAIYQLQTNEFNGRQTVQLNIRACMP